MVVGVFVVGIRSSCSNPRCEYPLRLCVVVVSVRVVLTVLDRVQYLVDRHVCCRNARRRCQVDNATPCLLNRLPRHEAVERLEVAVPHLLCALDASSRHPCPVASYFSHVHLLPLC